MRTVKATAHFYPPGAPGRYDTYDIDNVSQRYNETGRRGQALIGERNAVTLASR